MAGAPGPTRARRLQGGVGIASGRLVSSFWPEILRASCSLPFSWGACVLLSPWRRLAGEYSPSSARRREEALVTTLEPPVPPAGLRGRSIPVRRGRKYPAPHGRFHPDKAHKAAWGGSLR